MIDFIKNLFKKEIQPLSLSKEELTKIFSEQRVCPDCGVWDFRNGPSGGMSTNIYCANCGSWFNEQGPFGLDRIFKEANYDWRIIDKNTLVKYTNYKSYTWNILKKWYRVEIPISVDKDGIFNSVGWCGNNEVIELWSVKDGTVYFKNDTDAVAFKLRWL